MTQTTLKDSVYIKMTNNLLSLDYIEVIELMGILESYIERKNALLEKEDNKCISNMYKDDIQKAYQILKKLSAFDNIEINLNCDISNIKREK